MRSKQRAELSRPWDNRLIGGVAAGLADALNLDVTLVRVLFCLLALAKGLGVLLYLGLWLLMPQPGVGERDMAWVARHNVSELRGELGFSRDKLRHSWLQAGNRRWLAVALFSTGAVILLWSFGAFAFLSGTRAIGLAALLLGGGLLWGATGAGGRR